MFEMRSSKAAAVRSRILRLLNLGGRASRDRTSVKRKSRTTLNNLKKSVKPVSNSTVTKNR